jgi:c-di-GMP-binding flagellar brake protein YcgR
MRPRRILDRGETAELVSRAVAEHALAVLSVRCGEQWITFKSKFLERDPGNAFFVLDHQETHGAEPPELEPGQHIGVSFRHKSRKIMFASFVEAKGRFMVDNSTSVAAIRYRWPESMIEMQRRAYHRTVVPTGMHLRTTFWPGGASAERGSESLSIWGGQSLDLS